MHVTTRFVQIALILSPTHGKALQTRTSMCALAMKSRCFYPGFIVPDVVNMERTMGYLNRTCVDYNELGAIATGTGGPLYK